MSVCIRRERTFKKSFTVIVFDKDHVYRWPTNDYEHDQILKLYKQDAPHKNIQNDFTSWKELSSQS